jgi:BolA protein
MQIQNVIKQKLLSAFAPVALEVINESSNHNVAAGSESHFKVVIVSAVFDEMRLLQRHRAVNAVLAVELAEKIHALALHTYSPAEWYKDHAETSPISPKCLGGSKIVKASQ